MINSLIDLKCHNTFKNYEARFTEHKTKHMNIGNDPNIQQTERQTDRRERGSNEVSRRLAVHRAPNSRMRI